MVRHCKSCRQEKEEIEFNADGRAFKTCTLCRIKRKGGRKRLTIGQCKEYALNKGGLCLSDEYKDTITKMKWCCSEKHEWEAIFGNIKNLNQWCPYCYGTAKLTIEECKKHALNKGGECLSETYKNKETKMKWRCSENHEWEARFGCIKNMGNWCPYCSGNTKLTIEECQEHAISKGGECLSTEYKDTKTHMLWKCSENHEWESRFGDIKSGHWCPQCSSGRSEQLCREIFEEHYNAKFPNVRPKFLKGLELDGYNEELNIAFEYNGKQHYKYVPYFHRNGEQDFIEQQERDRMKYRICANKNIKLILIPYKFDCYNPDKLKIFILDAISTI